MNDSLRNRQIIEDTGTNYNEIIFEEDFIPSRVYLHQINLRNQIIEDLLANRKFFFVLDLGCGTGFHLKTLNRHADNLIGADMSFGALRECKKNNPGEYIVCDINHLPFKKDSLDCIWIAGVLHHVPDTLNFVISENLSHILRSGGYLIVDEPNNLNPLNYLILMLSKADPTGKEKPLSLSSVEKLLENAGLNIIQSDSYELLAPFGLLLKNNRIFRFSDSIDKLLQHSPLRSFLLRWTIFAKKE